MQKKRNTGLLLLSGTLFVGGLIAPLFTARPEARSDHHASQTYPEETRTELVAALEAAFTRILRFDRNQDGKVSRTELTDARLHHLFDRADANRDNSLTREELHEMFRRESTTLALDDDPRGTSEPGR
jgi:hypothetical protein